MWHLATVSKSYQMVQVTWLSSGVRPQPKMPNLTLPAWPEYPQTLTPRNKHNRLLPCRAAIPSRLTCWLSPFSSSHTQTGGGNLFFGCKLYLLMPTYNWQLALTCIGAAKWLWNLSAQLQVLLVKGKPRACFFFLPVFSLTNSCLLLPGHVWFLFRS